MGQEALVGAVIRVGQSEFKQISDFQHFRDMEQVRNVFHKGLADFNIPDSDGAWDYIPHEGMIRRRVVQGADTIGDIRISYYVPKEFKNGHSCSVLGKVGTDGSLIGLENLSRSITGSFITTKSDFINSFLVETD